MALCTSPGRVSALPHVRLCNIYPSPRPVRYTCLSDWMTRARLTLPAHCLPARRQTASRQPEYSSKTRLNGYKKTD